MLKAADKVLIRTGGAPAVRSLDDEGVAYETFDGFYENSRSYDALAGKIARAVRQCGKEGTVCYCTDGSASEDAAAQLLLKGRAKLIDGKSKASHFAALAGIGGNYTALSAFSVPDLPLSLPLVVYDLTDGNVSDVKLRLAEEFGDEAKAVLFDGAFRKDIPLYEADRRKGFGALSGLVIKDIPLLEKKRFSFGDAVGILKRLRAPDGCPWDRVQTHESIRENAVEEAYELVDAIDCKDPEKICEEAGDVLMQALFHTLIEEERGNFSVTDMLSALCEKLITRHTHVFGNDKASSADGALSVWDKNKMKEKRQETFSDAVNDVPLCFPALLRAQKICKRVEKGGWDPADVGTAGEKLREEYGELLEAYRSGEKERISSELGDLLFSAAWLARAVGADAETALADTVKKVQKRYTEYEALVRADGKDPLALTKEERDRYYGRVKDENA